MKTEIREVHRCGFCPKRLIVAKAMIRHEFLCKKNPNNKDKCFNCKNLRIEEGEKWWIDSSGEADSRMTGKPVFFCEAKGIGVHTNVFWKKYSDGSGEYGKKAFENGEEKMPIEHEDCEFFEHGEVQNNFDAF